MLFSTCQSLAEHDFMHRTKMLTQKKGKREYLNDTETKNFTHKLNEHFEITVEIPRIRVGKRQTIETFINEEALLFAQYLKSEKNGDQDLG